MAEVRKRETVDKYKIEDEQFQKNNKKNTKFKTTHTVR